MIEKLKQIIVNLPLVLSDSRDPADVSLNRVMTVVVAFFVLLAPGVTLAIMPEWFERLTPYWEKLLAFLAAQVAGNMFKNTLTLKVWCKMRVGKLCNKYKSNGNPGWSFSKIQ